MATTRNNALLSVGGQSGTLILSAIAAIITARWLGPSGRGILAMTTSGGYVGAMALSLGIGTGISTLLARRSMSVADAMKVAAVVVGVAALLALAIRFLAAPFVPADLLLVATWLPAAIATTIFSTMQTSAAIGSGNLKASATNAISTGVIQVVAYLFAARSIAAAPGVAIAIWAFAQGAGALVGWGMLVQRRPVRAPGIRPLRPQFPEMMRLSLAAFPGLLLGMANFRLDVFLLGFWSSPTQVGLYSMAALGVSALAIGPSALGQALMSRFGSSGVDPHAYLRRGMGLALLVAVGSGLLAIPGAFVLVPLVLGPKYAGTLPMFYALIPGFVLFSSCYVSTGYINVVLGRPWLNGRVAGVSLAVDLALLFALAPSMGGLGAAIASSVAYAIGALVNVIQLREPLFGSGLAPAFGSPDHRPDGPHAPEGS